MTYEEAIKELQILSGDMYDAYICKALKMGIEALEKQMPKKPNYMADDDTCVYYHWECPNCGIYYGHSIKQGLKALYGDDAYYCSRCGQRIDWSEVE